MNETTFKVHILNETIGVEKIARLASIEGTSFLRNASLSISKESIELSCSDDYGRYHSLGNIFLKDLTKIKFKKSAITPFQQMIKPATNGAFIGLTISIISWMKIGDRSVLNTFESVALSIGIMIVFAGILVFMNLEKIEPSRLSFVDFEAREGKSITVAVKDKEVEPLIESFEKLNFPVEKC